MPKNVEKIEEIFFEFSNWNQIWRRGCRTTPEKTSWSSINDVTIITLVQLLLSLCHIYLQKSSKTVFTSRHKILDPLPLKT